MSREEISPLQFHLRTITDSFPQQCQGITKLPRVVWMVLSVDSSQYDGTATEEGCALQLDLQETRNSRL